MSPPPTQQPRLLGACLPGKFPSTAHRLRILHGPHLLQMPSCPLAFAVNVVPCPFTTLIARNLPTAPLLPEIELRVTRSGSVIKASLALFRLWDLGATAARVRARARARA